MRGDVQAQAVRCRVAVCGPAGSGKSTFLDHLRGHAPRGAVLGTPEIHLSNTANALDRLEVDLGFVRGKHVIAEFVGAPGRPSASGLRRQALEDIHGVVFVADSRREALDEDIEGLNELFEALHNNGCDDAPMVMLFNKQDQPTALSPVQLNPLLNARSVPSLKGSASTGDGVFETVKRIVGDVLEHLRAKRPELGIADPSGSQQALPDNGPPSWLLTCHHCSAVLEVPHARVGDIFTCGSCGAALEVVEPERGVTRQPQRAKPKPVAKPPPASVPPRGEDSGYNMAALPDPSGSALTIAAGSSAGAGFPFPGFTVIAPLDEHLLGNRLRVQEGSASYRALLVAGPVLRQPGYRDRMEPELRLAGQCRHPGILPLRGMRAAGEHLTVLWADAPDHEPLTHVLARRRLLQPGQVVDIMRQVAGALEDAGRHGVVHGWLRPEIILADANGKILLDEIGLPKPHGFILRESLGASAATEHYLAPEHLLGDAPSDLRTDMFLLGAVAFRMLTGEGLVTGYSGHEALHKISATGCRGPRAVKPDTHRDLDAFCLRLTAIDRKDRFQSWRELIDAAERLNAGRQSMNLTRGVQRAGGRRTSSDEPATETPTAQRRVTGTQSGSKHSRAQTGPQRRTLSSSGARPLPREITGHGHVEPGAHRRRRGSGGSLVIVILLAAIALVALAIFVVPQLQRQSPKPRPSSEQTPPAPAPPAQPGPASPRSPEPNQTPAQTLPTPPVTPPTAPVVPATSPDEAKRQAVQAADQAIAAFEADVGNQQLLTAARAALHKVLEVDDRNSWRMLDERLKQAVSRSLSAPSTTPTTPPVELSPDEAPAAAASAQAQAAVEALIARGRFREASETARTLAPDRGDLLTAVEAGRAQAKLTLQRAVLAAKTLAEVDRLLIPVREHWGYPDDVAWAEALAAASAARLEPGLPADGSGSPDPAAGGASPETPAPRSPGGFSFHALRADRSLDRALLTGDLAAADQAIASLQADDGLRAVLELKRQLWQQRARVIANALATRKPAPRMRVQSPLANETQAWDVIGANERQLTIRAVNGSEMNLALGDLDAARLIAIFTGLAAGEGVQPIEAAVATAGMAIAGDVAQTALIQARARALGYERARDLELLSTMLKDREVLTQVDAVDNAVAANDPQLLKTALDALRKVGERSRDPGLLALITRHEASLQALSKGTPVSDRKDHLDFTDPNDLNTFPDRSGTWNISNRALANNGDGRLARGDCGNVRAMTLSMVVRSANGRAHIDFRGVRIILDIAGQAVLISAGDHRPAPASFPFLPQTAYTVTCSVADDGANLRIDINGAWNLSVPAGRLTPNLAIATETGAEISISELLLRRGAANPQSAAAIDPSLQENLRPLGLLPIGGAFKSPDSPAIVLPKQAGRRSGIAMGIAETGGVRFQVRGSGRLNLGLSTLDAEGRPRSTLRTIDLPAATEAPLDITLTWPSSGSPCTLRIAQANTEPTIVEFNSPTDATHLVILAEDRAEILATPVRQPR